MSSEPHDHAGGRAAIGTRQPHGSGHDPPRRRIRRRSGRTFSRGRRSARRPARHHAHGPSRARWSRSSARAAVASPRCCGSPRASTRPTAGVVRIDGDPVTGIDPRCAVAFQEPRLLPWRTLAGNVALGLPPGTPATVARTRVERAARAGRADRRSPAIDRARSRAAWPSGRRWPGRSPATLGAPARRAVRGARRPDPAADAGPPARRPRRRTDDGPARHPRRRRGPPARRPGDPARRRAGRGRRHDPPDRDRPGRPPARPRLGRAGRASRSLLAGLGIDRHAHAPTH